MIELLSAVTGDFGLSEALFILMGLGATWLMYRVQQSKNSFDFADLVMTHGFADPHKFLLLMAGGVSTWLIFHYALAYKLTESLFGIYIGAFVVNAIGQRGLGIYKGNKDQVVKDPKE